MQPLSNRSFLVFMAHPSVKGQEDQRNYIHTSNNLLDLVN
jgi:hypothetical protein